MIDTSLISIPGYGHPIRRDRYERRGGGVCVYYRADLPCSEVTDITDPPSCIECVWTAFPNCKLVLLALYVPPNLNAEQNSSVVE